MQSGPNQSQQKFRINREKYRENRKFAFQMTMPFKVNAATMRVLSELRYSKLTGNDFGVTGKL
jgi:hypothetical protein